MKIIFLGTPEFSVPSLDAIIKAGHQVAAVVTMPDKPAGRGMHLTQSAVKKFAVANNIPVLQPQKLKDENFITQLKNINADIHVVIAFRMLPQIVWNMPELGTINLHASLLPDYKGAAPINWAIINGETLTGVSTFLLKHEIDTGDILLQKEVHIQETTTAGQLHDTLMQVGANLIVETLDAVAKKNHVPIPQPIHVDKHAPKIFKQNCIINWENNCKDIYNLIRGLSPYPAAHTTLHGKTLKVYASGKEIIEHSNTLGESFSDGKTYIKYACTDGYIYLYEIQLEGKKRMTVGEFLRGYKWEENIL